MVKLIFTSRIASWYSMYLDIYVVHSSSPMLLRIFFVILMGEGPPAWWRVELWTRWGNLQLWTIFFWLYEFLCAIQRKLSDLWIYHQRPKPWKLRDDQRLQVSLSTNNLQHNLDRPQSHHHINIDHSAGPHCYTAPNDTGWSIAPWHRSSPSISITSVAGTSFIISTLPRTPPGIVHNSIPCQWWWGTQWVKMKQSLLLYHQSG